MLDLSEPLDVASAIRWCESRLEGVTMPGARRGFAACLLALRFQQEAEKNEPLTLEELLQMDGQPVYITKKEFHGI